MIVYGLIFMVPIAPFGIYGGVFTESGGMPALVYVVGTLAMVFTALSYGMLIREWPVSGSVYAYTSRGLGKGIGFVSGWTLLLDYLLIPVLMYVVASTALSGIVPEVPPWAFSIVFVVENTFVNIRGIALTDIVNRIALVLEVLVLAVFVVLGVRWLLSDPASHGFTLQPLYNPSTFSLPLVFSAVSLGVLSFLGFDGIATLSEEAKDGRRGPGRAMMASLAIVGALFVLQTYIAGCISPDGAVFAHDQGNAFYLVAQVVGGRWLYVVCAVATALAWGIFTALAAQTAVSRILFAMGRDGGLPHALARIHPKYHTPYVATLFVGGLTLVLVLTFGQLGTDTISLFVNFGALTAFLLLHVTVIWYFFVKKRDGRWVAHLLVPLAGLAVIGYTWWGLDVPAKVLGVVWMAAGTAYYLVLRFVLKREVTLGG
ncbi:APC family permease [Gordonibacter pamelaeae]|uniref:APC family permease n=1 Tax=Gordonibacter pamelaeae TaxID=471189 RepID=UPI00210DF323|nr:APC family permease [Gordonibacter pamelaeae]MCQ4847391.1 APC family permease [Gordonibacter pamelaeae]MCQ4849640.1 APC family permease [Gordonibacter pamelaeae]